MRFYFNYLAPILYKAQEQDNYCISEKDRPKEKDVLGNPKLRVVAGQ